MAELIAKCFGALTALLIIALLSFLLIRFSLPKLQTRKLARNGVLFGLTLSFMTVFAAQSLWFEADRALNVSKLEPFSTLERLVLSTREFDLLVSGFIDMAEEGDVVAHIGRSRANWLPNLSIRLGDGTTIPISEGYKAANWQAGGRVFEKALRSGEQVIVWGSSYLRFNELDQESAGITARIVYAGDFNSFQKSYARNLRILSPIGIRLAWLFLVLSPLPLVMSLRQYLRLPKQPPILN